MRAMDAPKPQYIVVTVHSEWEHSVAVFITREAAVEYANDQSGDDVYFAKLEPANPPKFPVGKCKVCGKDCEQGPEDNEQTIYYCSLECYYSD